MQTLEARLKEAALKNSALLQENASLRKQMNVLEKEVSLTLLVYFEMFSFRAITLTQ